MKKQFAKMMGISGVALLAVAPMVETGAATVDAVRTVNVVSAAEQINDNTSLALTITKYQTADMTKDPEGDGSQIDMTGKTPMKGIKYQVTKIKKAQGVEKIDPKDKATYQVIGTSVEQVTGDNGETTFDLGKYVDAKGIYLVHEVMTDEDGLKSVDDFMVQMPFKNQTHVYVYPKNELKDNTLNIMKTRGDLNYSAATDGDDRSDSAAIIGTKVPYTITASFPDTAISEAYILDPIYEGLTFDKVASVTLADGTKLVEGSDYTVAEVKNDNRSAFATQKINFTQDRTEQDGTVTKGGISKVRGKAVTVNFSATVNGDAITKDSNDAKQVMPIQNTADVVVKTPTGATITPGTFQPTGGVTPGDPLKDQPNVPTNPLDPNSSTSTKATNIQIAKTDKDDGKKLGGAVFQLYDANKELIPGSEVTTGDDGQAIISGIEQGKTYYLKETKAPDGYTTNHDFIEVTAVKQAPVGNEKTITNEKDIPLKDMNIPLTGGQLRIILMVTGTILILGAGYILIKKRKEEENA